MTRAARLVALALPLAGLTALWGWTDHLSRQGTDWLVPVTGYDPRDLLRGHYVQFSYDWPALEAPADRNSPPTELCLHGTAPRLDRVSLPVSGSACAHRARAGDAERAYAMGLTAGRVYIPQTQSEELTRKLGDPALRGFVVLRQREDGTITPRELRFRALTEAERQAREDADRADDRPPPIDLAAP